MTVFNKLVRDRIPEIIAKSGDTPHTKIITDNAEFIKVLTDKLIEEAREVQESPSLEELADTLEVVQTLTRTLGHSLEDLEHTRIDKAAKRGGFEKRIFLISKTSK